MPAIRATAPGKIILFGEHAVVYGQPAIAVPVSQVQARAMIMPEPRMPAGRLRIQAPDIGLETWLTDLPPQAPLRMAIDLLLTRVGIDHPPALTVRVTSSIPVASGLGSGAAVSVAVIRALAEFLGYRLRDEEVSLLAFEVEKVYHGTPSGIDNTVITYGKPVYFERRPTDNLVEMFKVGRSFMIAIGDTGVRSPTVHTVGDVRTAWEANPQRFEGLFDQIGAIARSARRAIEAGETESLGTLMDQNHALLVELGVSSLELEGLVNTARQAGALGAKLSGGGRGGNMIALVSDEMAEPVCQALRSAGARNTILTTIKRK
jgi:mevalonate kinase